MVRARLAKHPKNGDAQSDQAAVEATEPANGTISKAEAVRKAIAAGHDQPEQGVAYIKEQFGHDMGRSTSARPRASSRRRAEPNRLQRRPRPSPGGSRRRPRLMRPERRPSPTARRT